MIPESENKIINPDHYRILRIKLRWPGDGGRLTTWKAVSISYLDYKGQLSIEDLSRNSWSEATNLVTIGKAELVNFHLEENAYSVGKRFVDNEHLPSDLSIRLGIKNPNNVNFVFRMGNYNFIEVVVEGEKDLKVVLPLGIEHKFLAGKTSLLDLRKGIEDSKIIYAI